MINEKGVRKHETVMWALELHWYTPLLLGAVACVALAFIIHDAVLHTDLTQQDKTITAASIATTSTIGVANALRDGQVEVAKRLMNEAATSLKSCNAQRQAQAFRLAATSLGLLGPIKTLEVLEAACVELLVNSPNPRHARDATIAAHMFWSVSAERTTAVKDPADDPRVWLQSLGANVNCNPTHARFTKALYPTGWRGPCTSSYNDTLAAVLVRHPVDLRPFFDVRSSFNELFHVMMETAKSVQRQQDALNRQREDRYNTTMGLNILVLLLAVLGCVSMVAVIISETRSIKNQVVLQRDFLCTANWLRLHPRTLSTIDNLCSCLGVLTTPKPHEDDSLPQIELSLKRAVAPLCQLRAFAPQYMFLAPLSHPVSDALHDSGSYNAYALNLNVHTKKGNSTNLFVGWGHYNQPGERNIDEVSTMVSIVHKCTAHFSGTVIQVSSEGILCLFLQTTVNDGGDAERIEDGENLAAHCAFAIVSLCNNRAHPLPCSISIASGIAVHGVMKFFVSKHYTYFSPALTTTLVLEKLNVVHKTMILTTAAVSNVLSEVFLCKPIHYLLPVGSVYEIVLEEPHRDVPGRDAILEEQLRLRERVEHWSKGWGSYEKAMAVELPTVDMLQEAYQFLEGHKVFMLRGDEDTAFTVASTNVKKLAVQLGVTLGGMGYED